MSLSSHLPSRRGGALLSAILFTTVLIVLAGSALQLVVTERKVNARHALRLQARNLAEAQAEYGFAQIRFKMDTRSSIPAGLLNPTGPDRIVLPPIGTFPNVNFATAGRELIAGAVNPVTDPGSAFFFVDPADPANAFETLLSRRVIRKDVILLSRVTVNGNFGSPITARVSQRLSVRDIPLFSNAIFYNMDMELAPGPPMTVTGPVHVNGNLNVAVTRDDGSLTFNGPVTVSGGIFTGMSMASINKNGNFTLIGGPNGNTDTYSVNSSNRPMNFLTPSNHFANMRFIHTSNPALNMWRDHRMGTLVPTDVTLNDFRVFSSNTYGGNLQTSTHGIQVLNPAAAGNYVPDPTPLNGIDNSINDARSIIEPPLRSTELGFRAELEAQKLSRRSGIFISVNPSGVNRIARGPDGTTFTLPARQFRAFRQDGTEIILPGSTLATAGVNHAAPGGRPIISVKPGQMTDIRRIMPSFNEILPRSGANVYAPRTLDIVEFDITALKLAVERTVNNAVTATIFDYDSPTSQSTYGAGGTSNVAISAQNQITGLASANWNGAVYIQSVDAETRKDSGVRLINGRGRLPSAGAEPGLSIATNDALYVLGHFNSNGTATSAAASSTPEGGEVPAALLADSVTILSQPVFSGSNQTSGWNDRLSGNRHQSGGWASDWASSAWRVGSEIDGSGDNVDVPRNDPLSLSLTGPFSPHQRNEKFPATTTVVAAAIVSGVNPNGKNGSWQANGGAQNLPRYLENWNNTAESIIRGSMVGMFESRVTTELFSTRVFTPPVRIWGLNTLFSGGLYPPQTPVVRAYTRIDYREVSEAEYATIRTSFGW